LLKMRIIQQVTKQVSKEIKGLIQVVSKIYD
jgi:ribosomal protein L30/L7E